MTTDKMRAEFEASHLYADYHTPEEIEFDFVEFSRGWQAGVLAERERAAKVCDGLLELEEAAKSAEKIRVLRGTGGQSELSALQHGLDVDTYNAAIKKCIAAIRKGETP